MAIFIEDIEAIASAARSSRLLLPGRGNSPAYRVELPSMWYVTHAIAPHKLRWNSITSEILEAPALDNETDLSPD
ncbi:MAG: hypothetical protein HN368_08095 [Spirochaetales bacterium]|nr:hypothetical protein [Spirochaetales bacterium]